MSAEDPETVVVTTVSAIYDSAFDTLVAVGSPEVIDNAVTPAADPIHRPEGGVAATVAVVAISTVALFVLPVSH